jgi:hypothetical protein
MTFPSKNGFMSSSQLSPSVHHFSPRGRRKTTNHQPVTPAAPCSAHRPTGHGMLDTSTGAPEQRASVTRTPFRDGTNWNPLVSKG